MSVTVAPPPFLQFFNPNNSGSPAVSFQLFTYQAGSSTKQSTWTDSTQTSTNANPLQLNGNGYTAMWGDPTAAYKLVWAPANDTDPPTSPLYTLDNFYFPAAIPLITQAFIGGLLYPRTAAEIANGVTPANYAYAPGDIRRYGASLSASAAVNTAAIQSAQSGNFGVIYAPAGTFAYTVASVTNCTAYGLNALSKNGTGGTPGNNNTAFGTQALAALSGGISNPTGNTAVGYLALTNSNGATNTAVGDNCMSSDLTGSDNQAFGAQALFSETAATGNNCFGFQCGYYVTGNSNLLIGNYAGGGPNGPGAGVGLTTGTNNVGVGGGTLANLGSGSFNTAIGLGALLNNTGGNANVAIGYFAGTHANSANEFYLDNQDRGNNANEVANALMYGNFGSSAAVNRLRFNAQLTASVGTLCSPLVAPTIASAAGIAPNAAITFVSGTTTVTSITQPSWMNNGGRITLIPTGLWTWNTTGNIALGGSAVVNKALDFIWDGGTGKWYPTSIS